MNAFFFFCHSWGLSLLRMWEGDSFHCAFVTLPCWRTFLCSFQSAASASSLTFTVSRRPYLSLHPPCLKNRRRFLWRLCICRPWSREHAWLSHFANSQPLTASAFVVSYCLAWFDLELRLGVLVQDTVWGHDSGLKGSFRLHLRIAGLCGYWD